MKEWEAIASSPEDTVPCLVYFPGSQNSDITMNRRFKQVFLISKNLDRFNLSFGCDSASAVF
jgi:hypothetical protein